MNTQVRMQTAVAVAYSWYDCAAAAVPVVTMCTKWTQSKQEIKPWSRFFPTFDYLILRRFFLPLCAAATAPREILLVTIPTIHITKDYSPVLPHSTSPFMYTQRTSNREPNSYWRVSTTSKLRLSSWLLDRSSTSGFCKIQSPTKGSSERVYSTSISTTHRKSRQYARMWLRLEGKL